MRRKLRINKVEEVGLLSDNTLYVYQDDIVHRRNIHLGLSPYRLYTVKHDYRNHGFLTVDLEITDPDFEVPENLEHWDLF